MNGKEWTSKLRERMADYEEPISEGLWERIEGALPDENILSAGDPDTKEASTQDPKKVVPLRRWTAAAAVAAFLLLGGGYLYQNARKGTEKMEAVVKDVYHKVSDPQTSEKIITGEIAKAGDDMTGTPSTRTTIIQKNNSTLERYADLVAMATGTEIVEEMSIQSQDVMGKQEMNDLREQQSAEEPATPWNDDRVGLRKAEAQHHRVPSASQSSPYRVGTLSDTRRSNDRPFLSATFFVQNMVGGDKRMQSPVMMAQARANSYASAYESSITRVSKRLSPIYLYNYEEVTHHRQPVTFGLSVAYHLTNRLSLLTGATYTKLSSDFVQKMNGSKVTSEQQLYYLGIPLKVSYRLLDWHNFRIYGIGGIGMDVNVKAKTATEGMEQKMRKDHIQMSGDAALGIQYQVLPQIGLYVEPGMKYYVDNKSRVENFFKEHPANFNLQVGVRFDLNR